MKRDADWGTWLSIGAVGAVCAAIALRVVPMDVLEVPPAPAPSPRPTAVAAKPERKAEKNEKKAAPSRDAVRYYLDKPEHSFELPRELNELSGLSLAKDGKSLWAVHDERPVLYRLSTEDGSILQELDLGKHGDYESVEAVGDVVYVSRSDGALLVVDPSGQKQIETMQASRDVGMPCEVEGIAYDPKLERLLISCKNESLKSKKKGKTWEIYQLNLERKNVKHEPAYVIEEDQLSALGLKGRTFAPSGLAVHPDTGDLYILSSRGKMLVVMAPDGSLVWGEELDDQVHRQPEGIAFGRDGTMYVGDEAHGQRAMLHVVKPSKPVDDR